MSDTEAFDELAKRQGDWGGGYQAKRQMAANKLQEPPSEWAGIKAILDEYGLQAIDFVADFKAALAQPAQEPVAWMSEENDCIFFDADKPNPMDYKFWTPLYTAPPKREWVGLTDEEIRACLGPEAVRIPLGWSRLTRAIEAKLKEKNNGT